jgi:heme exporter protein D
MADFFSMGGYGFYIWSSFGMTALVLVIEAVSVKHHYKTVLRRLVRMTRVKAGAER